MNDDQLLQAFWGGFFCAADSGTYDCTIPFEDRGFGTVPRFLSCLGRSRFRRGFLMRQLLVFASERSYDNPSRAVPPNSHLWNPNRLDQTAARRARHA